jgi:hypothetical protein
MQIAQIHQQKQISMKRTQIGWVFLLVIPALVVTVYFADPNAFSFWPIVGGAALILLLFFKLTVKVTNDAVHFAFGIGLVRKKIPLADIVNCKPIRYAALGWGIRFRPGATLYNVSGNKAIELTIKGKERKIWIGTDKPDELAKYINAQLMPKSE